jgi:hypothetical protein
MKYHIVTCLTPFHAYILYVVFRKWSCVRTERSPSGAVFPHAK